MSERPQFLVQVVPITERNMFDIMGRTEPFYKELMLKDPAGGRKFQDFFTYVKEGAEAVFLVSPEPDHTDMAVAIERVVPTSFNGTDINVLARYLRVVKREFQNQRLGPVLTNEPLQRHGNIHGVTARTFTPFIFAAEESSPYIGQEAITPIHNKLFDSRTRGILIATFGENAPEVAESDPVTGLCIGVYPERMPEIFDLKEASERVIELWSRMLRLGFLFRRGDGIRYYADVKSTTGIDRFEYNYLEYSDEPVGAKINSIDERVNGAEFRQRRIGEFVDLTGRPLIRAA